MSVYVHVYVRTHVCVYVHCHYCMSSILRLLVGTNHGLVVMDTRNNVVTQVMATDSKLLSVCVCVCVCVSVGFKHLSLVVQAPIKHKHY